MAKRRPLPGEINRLRREGAYVHVLGMGAFSFQPCVTVPSRDFPIARYWVWQLEEAVAVLVHFSALVESGQLRRMEDPNGF